MFFLICGHIGSKHRRCQKERGPIVFCDQFNIVLANVQLPCVPEVFKFDTEWRTDVDQ